MTDKILAIYTRRTTGEYHHFDVYLLSEKLIKEELVQKTEAYNADNTKDYIVKLYDDPIILKLAQDTQSSWRRERVISNLKSICEDIRDSIDSLESWNDDIEELLKVQENDR